jgi:nitroreductase
MKRLESADLLAALNWRYATKQFDPARKIDVATWTALEDVLVLAPSSFGLQPWKFLVITDQPTKDALVPLSWGQRQLADASHVIVFAVKHPLTPEDIHRHVARTAEVQGTAIENLAGFEKVVAGFVENPPFGLEIRSWSTRQVYIALGQFMAAAALLGVDTCPMEGLDPVAYDRVLGLEGSGYFTVVACPAGYRADADKSAARAKVRFPKDHVLSHI